VPPYATSIEGVCGLIMHPPTDQGDAHKVLVVWERGVWAMPGGAVGWGESPLEALMREAKEEVDVTLDFQQVRAPLSTLGVPLCHLTVRRLAAFASSCAVLSCWCGPCVWSCAPS
jgi:8-oxo-dGTP pyrophosphatase MutT (NUDIX family)